MGQPLRNRPYSRLCLPFRVLLLLGAESRQRSHLTIQHMEVTVIRQPHARHTLLLHESRHLLLVHEYLHANDSWG